MKNCLILGSGRSGTSMLAGILHQAGYFLGDKLHNPHRSNPKGFFEWMTINRLNEDILTPYGKRNLAAIVMETFFKKGTVYNPLGKNQRWLLSLPPQVEVQNSTPRAETGIKEVIAHEPFCYKDPRFSYTLPVWKKYLPPGTVFICVFREPDVTVNSILEECKSREYLRSLYIHRRTAYRVWTNIYSHILSQQAENPGDFFFVHYRQVYDGTALPALSRMLETQLKADFVDPGLKRTKPGGAVPGSAKKIYRRLCELADYTSDCPAK